MDMKRFISTLSISVSALSVTFCLSLIASLIPNSSVSAVSAAGFDPGYIISDSIFTNNSSMSAAQIQNFLNAKVPVCDTNGTQTSEYGGGTRAQWGQANYGQSTFT